MDTVITAYVLPYVMGAMRTNKTVKDVQPYLMTMYDSWGNNRVVSIAVHLN